MLAGIATRKALRSRCNGKRLLLGDDIVSRKEETPLEHQALVVVGMILRTKGKENTAKVEKDGDVNATTMPTMNDGTV